MNDDEKKMTTLQTLREDQMRSMSPKARFYAEKKTWHNDNKISHDDDSVIHETGD